MGLASARPLQAAFKSAPSRFVTPVTELSKLMGIYSVAAYLHFDVTWVYTCHTSSCMYVGCFRSPQSLTDVNSCGLTQLPPSCNSKY
ncbi:hypothetical protein B7R74_13370 [Yersinia pseudotuberculosis]|nr:hypothetical protein B7R74_13370 [Yersinia pseudotuberculosis]